MRAIKSALIKYTGRLKKRWEQCVLYRYFDRKYSLGFQKRLMNSDFTILCSNCIGGVIYHRLGMKFLSPTINLFMTQPDFVSFCVHLDHYIGKDLHFVSNSQLSYPVATLPGDETGRIPSITIHFNHSHSAQEAEASWNERKSRIHPENLYLILYYLDGITIQQLKQLEQFPCQNKVVLTSVPLPEINWSYYIKPARHRKFASAYLDRNLVGLRRFERKFDFVGFLNTKSREET